MEVVGQPPRLSQVSSHDHPPKSPGRNSFFIQDILSPEFGNRQLKEQYYAYLHYYYSLHMHNMLVLRNQQQLHQRMHQKDHKLDEDHTGGVCFEQKIKADAVSSAGVIRPIPRNLMAGATVLHPTSFPMEPPSPVALKQMASLSEGKHPAQHLHSLDSPSVHSNRKGSDLLKLHRDRHELQADRQRNNVSDFSSKDSLSESKGCSGEGGENVEGTGKGCQTGEEDQEDSKSRGDNKSLWPAWVYCTRYSDRPSSGRFKNIMIYNCFMFCIGQGFLIPNW